MILMAAISGWLIASLFIVILFRPYSPKKIIGYSFSGILPALQPKLASSVAAAIGQKYLSEEIIKEKLDNPALIDQIKPDIEEQVDLFLKNKLPEAFPLLSKLMGEKTLLKFKEAFLSEVETIFPAMINRLAEKTMLENDPEKWIAEKLNAIPLKDVKAFFYTHASRQLFVFKLMAAIIGAITGIVQFFILYLLQ